MLALSLKVSISGNRNDFVTSSVASVITIAISFDEIELIMGSFERLYVDKLISCSVSTSAPKSKFRHQSSKNSSLVQRMEKFHDIVLIYGDEYDKAQEALIEFILKSIREDLSAIIPKAPTEILFRDISTFQNNRVTGTQLSSKKVNISLFSASTLLLQHSSKLPGTSSFTDSNRLIIILNVPRELSNAVKLSYSDEWTFHLTLKLNSALEQYSILFNRDEIHGSYSDIILVFGNRMKPHFTISQLQSHIPRIDASTKFFCVSDKESYEKLVGSQFNINDHRLYEILCYQNLSDHDDVISKIPSIFWKTMLILAGNFSKKLFRKIEEAFPHYTKRKITGPEENQNTVTNYLILVLGDIDKNNCLIASLVELFEKTQIKNWVYLICHTKDSKFIRSVILSCNKLHLLETYLTQEPFEAPANVLDKIPAVTPETGRNLLIITWRISELVYQYLIHNFTNSFTSSTIRQINEDLMPLTLFYDEVVLICGEPFSSQ